MSQSLKNLIPVLGLLALLSGCVTDDHPPMLIGTGWILSSWDNGESVSEDSDITLRFDADRISGKAAVNRYTASYTLEKGGKLRIGNTASTMMAGPEALMLDEGRYLGLLPQVALIRVESGYLSLQDAHGDTLLTFEEAPK